MNVKRMWLPNSKGNGPGGQRGRNGLVAVAIDKDKSSQYAIKWAIENLLAKGQVVILIHVIQRASVDSFVNNYALTGLNGAANGNKQILDKQARDLFITFHCFCTRKGIQCFDVVLEDTDIAKAITEYAAHAAIKNLVLGSSRHGFIRRLKTVDVPTNVSKGSPDFCTVYVVSKTKISSVRNASRVAPFTSPLMPHIQQRMEQGNGNTTIVMSPDARNTPRHIPSIRGIWAALQQNEKKYMQASGIIRGNGELFGKGGHSLSEVDWRRC